MESFSQLMPIIVPVKGDNPQRLPPSLQGIIDAENFRVLMVRIGDVYAVAFWIQLATCVS